MSTGYAYGMNQEEIKSVMALLTTGERFKYPEAFKLMTYQTKDKRATETIWNSRDGVAPFGLSVKDEESSMDGLLHVHQGADRSIPWHVPNIGARIFVDSTMELCMNRAAGHIVKDWGPALKKEFKNQRTAVIMLAKSWYREGAPWIVTVTAEIQKEFVDRLDAFQDMAERNARGQA